MSPTRSSWIPTLAAALLVLVAYGLVLRALPHHVFWSPDEGAKLIQLRALQSPDEGWGSLPYRGAFLDPQYDFYPSACRHDMLYPAPGPDGDVIFHWPSWFPMATGLLESWFGLVGLYLLPLACGWLVALVAARLAAFEDARLAPAALILVGLATPIFFYSVRYWEHTAVTLFGLLAVWLAIRPGRLGALAVFPVGVLLVAATVLRIEMIAFAAALAGGWALARLAARRWSGAAAATPDQRALRASRLLLISIGAIAVGGAALLAALTLAPRHLQFLYVIPTMLRQNLDKLPWLHVAMVRIFINESGSRGPELPFLWELAALAAFGGIAVAAFMRQRLQTVVLLSCLFFGLQFSFLLLAQRQPYVSVHGLLPIAPYIAVAAFALPRAWRRRDVPLLTLCATAVLYVLFGFFSVFSFLFHSGGNYQTGLEWGMRNLLTLYPIAAVLALVGLRSVWTSNRALLVRQAFALLVAGMMLVGLLFELRGLRALHRSLDLVARWQGAFEREERVVTDVWWLAAAVAPFFTTHEMYCIPEDRSATEWVSTAAAAGVDTFSFASLRPPRRMQLDTDTLRAVGIEHGVEGGLYVSRFRIEPATSGGAAKENP